MRRLPKSREYTNVTSWLRIDFTGRRSGQRQRSSPCRCANPGRRVMSALSAGRLSRAVALKLCCRERKGNALPSCTVFLRRFHRGSKPRTEPCNFRIFPKTALATAALLVAANAANAAPPDLRTPAPVIHLVDNLDEADDLGWCIDTIGRGLSDRLHAHSCKPRGGDVQFRFAETTGQIVSVAFEGKCMANLHPEDSTEPLGLVDCDASASVQRFIYDPESMTIRPSEDGTRCLSVGADSRSAGPFMARDLRFSECSEARKRFQQWIVRR